MSDCIIWDGYINPAHGYGITEDRKRAHRVAYEASKGPIPEGLSVDHLCGTKACVNPEHLEAVTNAENIRRHFRKQTTCRRGGHPLDGINGRSGRRYCLTCHREREYARKHPTLGLEVENG